MESREQSADSSKPYRKPRAFNCLQVFLECLPADIEQWSPTIKVSRQEYEELKQSLASDPRNERFSQNIEEENPLSQSDKVSALKSFANIQFEVDWYNRYTRTCDKAPFHLQRAWLVTCFFNGMLICSYH